MIEILAQSTPSCLTARFTGKVIGEEYQQFLDAMEERMRSASLIHQ